MAKVRYGNDKNLMLSDLVEKAVRKPPKTATSRAFRKWMPSLGMLVDAIERPNNLSKQLITTPRDSAL